MVASSAFADDAGQKYIIFDLKYYMARFLAQIELMDANTEDYEVLEKEMINHSFSKQIQDEEGVMYKLPKGMFHRSADNETIGVVLIRAKQALKIVNKRYWILVSEMNTAIFELQKILQKHLPVLFCNILLLVACKY